MKCSIVERTLDILDVQEPEKQINQLPFNHVYYGSVVTKKIVLFNNSPIPSDFVISIDEEMSECVNKGRNLAMALMRCESINPEQETTPCLDSIFKVHPQKVSLQSTECCCMHIQSGSLLAC